MEPSFSGRGGGCAGLLPWRGGGGVGSEAVVAAAASVSAAVCGRAGSAIVGILRGWGCGGHIGEIMTDCVPEILLCIRKVDTKGVT